MKVKYEQDLKQALLKEQKKLTDELNQQKIQLNAEYQKKIDDFKKSNELQQQSFGQKLQHEQTVE
jgi:hypothetical protein